MAGEGVAPPASLWIFCGAEVFGVVVNAVDCFAEVSGVVAGSVNCGAEVSGVGIYGVGSPDEVPEWVFTA